MVDVWIVCPDGQKIAVSSSWQGDYLGSQNRHGLGYDACLEAIFRHYLPAISSASSSQACQQENKDLMDDDEFVRFYEKIKDQVYFTYNGNVLGKDELKNLFLLESSSCPFMLLQCKGRLLGGMDRQNRVGSKFGGGGVSSAQQSERERKERLKQLALESIDLAKDPYLVRNHLGSYECKLCLTLHRDEANYLAHTQGKKHQAGLARRAYLDKLQAERDANAAVVSTTPQTTTTTTAGVVTSSSLLPQLRRVRIGRPAYQVFKSREADTNQRCLSFELQYPAIEEGLQPRHRFMSAFEQKVDSPPDRRYQYLLFAAEPYETVAFKIPNEPIDKGENRFVTYWDDANKKFIVTLYFLNPETPTTTTAAAAPAGGE